MEAVSTPGPSCKPEHNQIAGESCPGNRAPSLCRLLKAESSRCLKSRVKAISLGSSHLQRATACKAASLSCPQPPHSEMCPLSLSRVTYNHHQQPPSRSALPQHTTNFPVHRNATVTALIPLFESSIFHTYFIFDAF